MGRRLDLQNMLEKLYREVTHQSPDRKVYFQPPATVRLTYPCLIYKLSDMPADHANNFPYRIEHEYELTVIDSDPNSPLRERISKLPICRFVRSYETDNLHHYVFNIYD